MADWRKAASGGSDWRMQAGGAQGGPSGDEPINPEAYIPPAETPVDPREIELRQQESEHRKRALASSLSGGQSMGSAPKAEREAFQERLPTGAVAEALSVARGASGPFGAHLDEAAGVLKSGSLSGPDYEREKRLAQQTIDAATGHMPAGPIIGAVALPQPSSAIGRVGLNTVLGASEGVGEAESLKDAPTEAMKKAAVTAILSILTEGAAKSAKGMGSNLSNRETASRQALKAAGLRGGIGSQLAKRGSSWASPFVLL